MKKTISINIKGVSFILEEDAFELLKKYLLEIKEKLKNSEESDEIIEDIELRIAELFSDLLDENKSVIELKDVENIINRLGKPADYLVDEEEDQRESQKGNKKLFRDEDDAIVAGVCAGFANYFGLSRVIVRLALVLLTITSGFGILLYIILWIIIPKAKTSVDKLKMKGKPVTISTLQEEVEKASKKIHHSSKKIHHSSKKLLKENGPLHKFGKGLENVLKKIFSSIRSVLGILLMILSAALLVPMVIILIMGFEFIPASTTSGFLSVLDLGSFVITSSSDFISAWSGALLLGFSIILFICMVGVNLFFRIKNNWTYITLSALFFTGLIGAVVCAYVGIKTGKDFSKDMAITTNIGTNESNSLWIDFNSNEHQDIDFMEVTENEISLDDIKIKYIASTDSSFHVIQEKSARGMSNELALQRAKNIQYQTDLDSNKLVLDTKYSFPIDNKMRDQDVSIIIEVPKDGIVVYKNDTLNLSELNNETRNILYARFNNREIYVY